MSLSTAHIFPQGVTISNELREFTLTQAQNARNCGAEFVDAVDKQFGQYHLRPVRRKVSEYIWSGVGDAETAAKVSRLDEFRKTVQKPEHAVVTFWDGASLGTVKRQRMAADQVGGGVRGVAKEFSRQSARRLQRTIAKIDYRSSVH